MAMCFPRCRAMRGREEQWNSRFSTREIYDTVVGAQTLPAVADSMPDLDSFRTDELQRGHGCAWVELVSQHERNLELTPF